MDTEEFRNRVRSALRLLPDGQAFKVGDLTFDFTDTTHFLVSGWTNNNRLENETIDEPAAILRVGWGLKDIIVVNGNLG